MENAGTREIILSIVQDKIPYQSFIGDIYNLSYEYGIDFYELMINCKYPKPYSHHGVIPEEISYELNECLKFWNVKEKRTIFSTNLEEHVPAR